VSNIPSVIKNLKLRITQIEGYNAGLADESCKQQAKIAELQKEKAEYIPVIAWIARECNQVDGDMLHRLKSYLATRDLEQQAKGVYNVRATTGFWNLSTCSLRTHLREYEIILINQAKELKEQE
jgi:hypothetical protein